MCMPVMSGKDVESLGLCPLAYIWNEKPTDGLPSLSVNGEGIGHLLESFVPREHELFVSIRKEIMQALVEVSHKATVSACSKTSMMPSEMFKILS